MLEVKYLLLHQAMHLPLLLSTESGGVARPAALRGQVRPGQACDGRHRVWCGDSYAICAEGSHGTYSYTGRALGKRGRSYQHSHQGRGSSGLGGGRARPTPTNGAACHYKGGHFVSGVAILSNLTLKTELAARSWGLRYKAVQPADAEGGRRDT